MYIIVTSKTSSLLASEGGIKYIIIGALSSACFLVGMFLLYFELGTLNLHDLNFLILTNFKTSNININQITIAYIFLICGFLIKLGSVPFHMWYIDIYQTLDY